MRLIAWVRLNIYPQTDRTDFTITGAHFLTRNNSILNPPINPLRHEAVLAARVFHHRNALSSFAHIRGIGTSAAPQLYTRRPRPIIFAKL